MTAPLFQGSGGGVNAPSGSDLTLPVPAGDGVTPRLLVAVICEIAAGGNPAPPDASWHRFGATGLWLFAKFDADGSATSAVTFAAWNDAGGPQNVGVVVSYTGATSFDAISAVTKTVGGFVSAPTVRTVTDDTAVLAIFGAVPNRGAQVIGDFTFQQPTIRVHHCPSTGNKVWLGVSDAALDTAGKSAVARANAGGSCNWRTLTVALHGNQTPNAPTLLSPPDAAVLDASADQEFTWQFSDPDVGDSQYAYGLELTNLTTSSVTNLTGFTPDNLRTIASGGLTAGDQYQWRVHTQDLHGHATGPYSAARTFTAAARPDAPDITAPGDGDTVTTADLTVSLDFGASRVWYQLRRVADDSGSPDLSTVYFDTGPKRVSPIGSPPTVPSTVDVPVHLDITGRTEHVQARCALGTSSTGPTLWSDWTGISIDVAFTPPPTPTGSVAVGSAYPGSMTVTYATAGPTGDEPAATAVDIYWSTDGGTTTHLEDDATALPISGTWTFGTPASGKPHVFQVVAVAADGAVAASGWLT